MHIREASTCEGGTLVVGPPSARPGPAGHISATNSIQSMRCGKGRGAKQRARCLCEPSCHDCFGLIRTADGFDFYCALLHFLFRRHQREKRLAAYNTIPPSCQEVPNRCQPARLHRRSYLLTTRIPPRPTRHTRERSPGETARPFQRSSRHLQRCSLQGCCPIPTPQSRRVPERVGR